MEARAMARAIVVVDVYCIRNRLAEDGTELTPFQVNTWLCESGFHPCVNGSSWLCDEESLTTLTQREFTVLRRVMD
jgi:hypothetical protein